MSERWKKIKRVLLVKDEDLNPTQRKIVLAVDLALMTLLLWMTWMRLGCPLPTAELEFRRLERTHLLPRSEIVFSNGERSRDRLRVSSQDRSVFALDGTELHLRGRWMAGAGERWASVAYLSERELRRFPLEDGPTLAPLEEWEGYLGHNGYWVTQGPGETPEGDPAYVYNYHNFAPFLLIGAPEETAGAELTLQIEGTEYSGGGWKLSGGIWMLGTEMAGMTERPPDLPYTLRLYRADGSLLLEKRGALEKG